MNPQILEKLKGLGIELPETSTPGGNYSSVNIRNGIAYIAIQFPIRNREYLYQGKLGKEISTEMGYKASQLCAINVLAQIESKVGIQRIAGINHFDLYYISDSQWDDSPVVANGASDLFNGVLEEKGKHSRAILGLTNLPRNFCVGLTSSFSLL